MCKKLMVSIIALCFLTVQSFAATNNGLKAAFDSLNYSLTVEWNQTDRAFYNAEMAKFAESIRAANVTNQELVEFTVSQVKDQKLAQDLRTAFTMVQINKMDQKEAQKYVVDVMNKSYSHGASWNGGAVIGGALLVIVIVAVALLATGDARINDNEECYEVYTCDDYCTAGVCYEDCGYECI
jgi:hypothetical protein